MESWRNVDEAFTDVALGIRKVVNELWSPGAAKVHMAAMSECDEITIVIDMKMSEFDGRVQKWLRHGLAEFLGISAEDIQIVSHEEGSVKACPYPHSLWCYLALLSCASIDLQA